MDWYSLNTSAVAKGSLSRIGGGAIIRDHCGVFIFAISTNFGRCNAFKAENLALTKGLELARDIQIKKLQIQLDNLACVQMLQK